MLSSLTRPRADVLRPLPSEAPAGSGEVVGATAGDNPREFDDIVRVHSRRVFNFLHQMTRQRQDAEDLTQQTFIKAFHNLHRFDRERPIINWLLTIARRTALNHFRAAKKWELMPESLAAAGPSPAHSAEEKDQANSVWERARRLLSQREFEVMWLRFGEDMSTAETARIVGITQPHVKILVYRARQQLLKGKAPL